MFGTWGFDTFWLFYFTLLRYLLFFLSHRVLSLLGEVCHSGSPGTLPISTLWRTWEKLGMCCFSCFLVSGQERCSALAFCVLSRRSILVQGIHSGGNSVNNIGATASEDWTEERQYRSHQWVGITKLKPLAECATPASELPHLVGGETGVLTPDIPIIASGLLPLPYLWEGSLFYNVPVWCSLKIRMYYSMYKY